MKDGDATTILGSLFPCLTAHKVKKLFLKLKQNFMYLVFVLISSCPSTEHLSEDSVVVFFTFAITYLYTLIRFPCEASLLQAEQSHLF